MVIASSIILVVAAACSGSSGSTPATTAAPGETAVTTVAPGETAATTVAPATTSTEAVGNLLPMVTGLAVEAGPGGDEVTVSWDVISDADIDDYLVWYSDEPGGKKRLAIVYSYDPGDDVDGRLITVHSGLDFVQSGKNCYEVSAKDADWNEGERSPEVCLP